MSVARRVQSNRRLVRDGATSDDVERAKGRLGAVFAAYPGIVAPASSVEADADGFVVVCALGAGDSGRAAALAVDFIAGRVGASAATASGATRVRCSATQFVRFQHYLHYASQLQVGHRPAASLSEPPLPTLLGRALGAFMGDYDHARGEGSATPQLPVWANVLRVLDTEGVEQRQFGRRAVISKRMTEMTVNRLERRGRVAVDAVSVPGKRGRTRFVRLTTEGQAARDAGADLVATVEHDWRQRFGIADIARLRDALAAIVDRLPIELPYCVTGYGAGDPSVTGGDYVSEDPGPPRVPAHGQEWPVVMRMRRSDSEARRLPLPALLSQALAAFAIDYEREGLGSLQTAVNFLRFIGDDGITLQRAQALGRVSGNGKTLHERHLDVVVAPGRASDKNRRVYPTPKSRRARDAYPHLVMEIEQHWREKYGDAVAAVRAVLGTADEQFDADLLDYPDTIAWIQRLWAD